MTIMGHVQHAAILDAGARANVNFMHVSAEHGPRPDGCILADGDATDNHRRLIHVGARSDGRGDSLEPSNSHNALRGSVPRMSSGALTPVKPRRLAAFAVR